MFLKRAWIPVLAGLALMVGCDSKPSDKVPTTAPMAAKEPFEILNHLKYLAVRKDYKDLPVIAPSDLTGLYGNAFWFHDHAGTMGLSLTAEEIQALGVGAVKDLGYLAPGVSCKDLQDNKDKVEAGVMPALPASMVGLDLIKLDKLPNNASKDKAVVQDYTKISDPTILRAVFNAGIYRLMKGIPADMWPEINVMEVKQNAGNTKAKDVYLGYKGETLMQVAVQPNADGNLGIIYIYFKVHPKKIAKMFAENAGAK
jgi:hypothetical protein